MRTVPAKNLPAQSRTLLSRLKKEKAALLTNANGQPAAYLVDSTAFEDMQAQLRLLEGIARGEKAIREGRTLTHAQAKKKLARWLKK